MYGLVNRALQDLIASQYGEERWEEIRRRAGIDIESFVCMTPYPDDVTYKLAAAASEVLGCPPDALLDQLRGLLNRADRSPTAPRKKSGE